MHARMHLFAARHRVECTVVYCMRDRDGGAVLVLGRVCTCCLLFVRCVVLSVALFGVKS
jgi:hypothetical protein